MDGLLVAVNCNNSTSWKGILEKVRNIADFI